MQRGRRDAETLRIGDIVDCWRVEKLEKPRIILFRAEMKVFGRAWLQFEVESKSGSTSIRQTAIYDPRGFLGLAYWYALYPLHEIVFHGMLREIGNVIVGRDNPETPIRPKKVSGGSERYHVDCPVKRNVELRDSDAHAAVK